MKTIAITALLCASVVAISQAADWSSYDNARFGYRIDIPPGFSAVAEAANGDGGVSQSDNGHTELRVWGGYLTEGDFEAEVRWRIDQDVADGWNVTYQKQHSSWASWSGAKRERIFYERAIPACDGAVVYFRLEYKKSQLKAFDPVVARLVKSLRSRMC
ncbi:hypothetical protein [Mesorhizobium sp.]|uniref:hypothetical protein n=1 Tax=Mesorhizobium sp. TaxID=1871066 RepID=UPI000FEA7DB6|nr:hypothetical protein [Mesorhizobium sp.]RWD28658.1 MAG: hypothetical protein EOS34_29590 [Mesorhizobium sp.]RWE98576.1 MAG: hypothetical protein EOS43_17320 [Mesorhizobium sp.]